MKVNNPLFIAFLAVVLLGNVLMIVLNFRSYGREGRTPTDFRLRMNECECLKERFNPFLISTGEVKHERYVPFHALSEKAVPDHEGEPVGMYPPWTYSLYLPLSCLPRNVAWMVWYSISVLALAGIGIFAFCLGRKSTQSLDGGVLCAATALSIFPASYLDLDMGNLCLVIAFSLVGILHSITHAGWRSSVLGGLCLTVAMMKPQLGLLFGIPMLLARRYAAIALAAVLLLLLSIAPSVLCGTSPIIMALQTPQANEPGFHGCGLMPESLSDWICAHFHVGLSVPLMIAVLVGGGLCAVLSWKLRRHPNGLLRIMPAAALSVLWTYAAFYNYAVCWIVLVVLAIEFLHASFGYRMFLAAAFFLFVRGSRPIVRVAELFGLSEPYDAFGGWGGLFTGFCNSACVVALVVVCLVVIFRDMKASQDEAGS